MKKITEYCSMWKCLFVGALIILVYLVTISFNEVVALYRLNWPPYNSEGSIILSLHWGEGEITLNSMRKVPGLKKYSIGSNIKASNFLYKVVAEDNSTLKTDYISLPDNIHYDYFDESTGELIGGQMKRTQCDFVIRIPYFTLSKQIQFYKTRRPVSNDYTKQRFLLERSDDCKLVGEIDL
jgi:hypothetical protein